MDKRILVYNNRTGVADKVMPLCRQEEIEVLVAESTAQLQAMLERQELHLMLVDVDFDRDKWNEGIRLIAELRGKSRIPMIVVSDSHAEPAKIMSLEAGADDYVTSDCNPLVLLARIKSQLRRYTEIRKRQEKAAGICRVRGLILNEQQRTVTVEGRSVKLTPIEYRILHFLMQEQGKVLSTEQIYENVWKERAFHEEKTIMVHICHIRQKIGDDPRNPRYLKAVWGYGYKVG